MAKVGFIGAGKMAEAILAGLLARGAARPDDIFASDVSEERLAQVHGLYGVGTTTDNVEVVARSATLVLAVKPQQLDEVLRRLAPHVTPAHLVVSIAAGKRTAHIEAFLPAARVVRVMPNLACLVGEGMNVFTRGIRASADDGKNVADLLACCGRAMELPESLFDAVTALSGSGPAFFAYLLDRLVDGAVKEGLSRSDALVLAEQTMLGTARLLSEKRLQPAELAAAVTSAKGTTAAGREVLETTAVAELLERTIQAAARRSRELGRS